METAVPAFVGRARRGPVNQPTVILSMADFTRVFGGMWDQSEMPHAVAQYFLNGGSKAVAGQIPGWTSSPEEVVAQS